MKFDKSHLASIKSCISHHARMLRAPCSLTCICPSSTIVVFVLSTMPVLVTCLLYMYIDDCIAVSFSVLNSMTVLNEVIVLHFILFFPQY